MEQYKVLWENTREVLDKKISAIGISTWIEKIVPIDLSGTKLIVSVDSEIVANIIATKYLDKIREALAEAKTGLIDIEILVQTTKEDYQKEKAKSDGKIKANFNPKYTFDNFVVGNSNKFVFAAAQAVAKADTEKKYNPLFIYGKTGLGKTHIVNAIGNHMQAAFPKLKVVYVTGEKFTNELIDSIRMGKDRSSNIDFRTKYRNIDVLIIDDIHFIANKPSTQEEFFHTFNELYKDEKQIIITSDRPPKEIATLEERLKTRFEWGLMADVQAPDLETKIAILQKKSEQNKIVAGIDVLNLIASRVESDVRELEGLLNRVAFYSTLMGKPLTVELAKEALKDYAENSEEAITHDTIINAICSYFNVTKQDLVSKKKNKEIVDPRQVCIYMMTEFLTLPLTAIGKILGGRDHTTIIHARDKISKGMKTSDKINTWIKDLRNLIMKK